ncbi:MAG: RtcB family protein [Chthoniobacter sp.]|nr:RtcB family protein [Chthoniobacter sp.]
MGCEFQQRREHDVMDEDWSISPVTQRLHDKAWKQLGTSGSGNHFVEFGAFTVDAEQARALDLEPGEYLALLTHSGSRGTGAQVCDFYSKRAMAAMRAYRRNSSTSRGSRSTMPTVRNTGPR